MNVVKQENDIDDNNIDATLRNGVKQEFTEIELTIENIHVEEQGCAQATSPPASNQINVTEQDVFVKVEWEDTDQDIEPTVLQHMDTYYGSNQGNTIVYGDNDPVPCNRVTKDNLEGKGRDSLINRCNLCQKVFVNPSSLKRHIKHMHGEVSYKCSQCEAIFRRQDYLQTHIKRVHSKEQRKDAESNMYTCDYCQKTFSKSVDVKKHITIVHSAGMEKCNVCGKLLKTNCLKSHMLTVHSDSKLQCKICLQIIKSGTRLHNHLNEVHGQESTDSPLLKRCNFCQKVFTSKQSLKRHIKLVHGENSYRCSQCEASFTRKVLLKRHIKCVHSKEQNEESNQQSTGSVLEENGESKHPTVDEANAGTSTSTQQYEVVFVKEELHDEELELDPVAFQYVECNYRPYKEEPSLD